jgi:hypothetical protein
MDVPAVAGSIMKSALTKKIAISVVGIVAGYGARFLTGKVYDGIFDPNEELYKGIFGE